LAPIIVALATLIVLLVVGFGVDRVTRDRLVAQKRADVRLRLVPYAKTLTVALQRRVERVTGLKAFVEGVRSADELSREFPVLAKGLMQGATGVRSFELARDGVIRWVYPSAGNESVIGFDLNADPRPGRIEEMQRAMATDAVTLTAPVTVLQGGNGLIARQRIARKSPELPDLAIVVVDLDSILAVAGLLDGVSGLDVAVFERRGRLLGPPRAVSPPDPEEVAVPAVDGNWRLVGAPTGGWFAAVGGALGGERFAGLLIALLLSGLAYLATERQLRLTAAVRARTLELERMNADLQREVREREEAEAALRRNEEQLLHSQKMEAVGTLAGGIAHDFNNVLTAIVGFGGLALDRARELAAGDTTDAGLGELCEDIEELLRATQHAVLVTNQLLAFSRKQIVQPESIDPGSVVREIEGLLQRLLGERIRLETRVAGNLPRVFVDAGQLTQVLVNLAVNARDAMPDGGRLTIEASAVSVEIGSARARRGVLPGRYVELVIADTGLGMTADVQARIFEPFFTTKGLGKGTGLGLSTVYGIVLRLGGRVLVESEPGKGTTFRVLVRQYEPKVEPVPAPETTRPTATNCETILVVEDESGVRQLTTRVLSRLGFRVLEAASGEEAIALSGASGDHIHLLLTDLVMPGISGREVAQRLGKDRPGMRVLFMSGYSEEADRLADVDGGRATLMTKPFTPEVLAKRVRDVLDAA
jgi:signal transduction histidine kinase/CheY-like chemotaxis protein